MFTSGKKNMDGIYRDVVDGTGLGSTQHVYVWEEEWTVFIEISLLGKGLYSMFTSGK